MGATRSGSLEAPEASTPSKASCFEELVRRGHSRREICGTVAVNTVDKRQRSSAADLPVRGAHGETRLAQERGRVRRRHAAGGAGVASGFSGLGVHRLPIWSCVRAAGREVREVHAGDAHGGARERSP